MIDLDIRLSLSDGQRQFALAARVSTDVPVTALYGPSGSGKSLTLQAIAGLLRPDQGHIRVAGRTLFDASQGIDLAPPQRRVGYLFQDYALFPHLTVRENVGFGLTTWYRRSLSRAQAATVDALLDTFGLSAMAHSRPRTLSGGQQQRVALARALACEPDVLLLDEPFAALNPMLRDALRQELAQVRARWNIPIVMITHDVDDVLALADVAFVYEHGQIAQEIDMHTGDSRQRVREQWAPGKVDGNPVHRKVRSLLAGSTPGTR